MNTKIQARFKELRIDMEGIDKTKEVSSSEYTRGNTYVDGDLLKEWVYKVQNLTILATGENSMYSKELSNNKQRQGLMTNADIFDNLKAVFKALQDDYEKGYLSSIQALIQAEVFDNELEQATELLNKKYKAAAAVIAGVVLETGLRALCDKNSIPHGKLDKMNSELTKLGIYNRLQQKRITALADIRNSAAHGKEQEYNHDDVKTMIRDIESFLATYIK